MAKKSELTSKDEPIDIPPVKMRLQRYLQVYWPNLHTYAKSYLEGLHYGTNDKIKTKDEWDQEMVYHGLLKE